MQVAGEEFLEGLRLVWWSASATVTSLHASGSQGRCVRIMSLSASFPSSTSDSAAAPLNALATLAIRIWSLAPSDRRCRDSRPQRSERSAGHHAGRSPRHQGTHRASRPDGASPAPALRRRSARSARRQLRRCRMPRRGGPRRNKETRRRRSGSERDRPGVSQQNRDETVAQAWIFSPRSSIATNFRNRRSLVSGFLASPRR